MMRSKWLIALAAVALMAGAVQATPTIALTSSVSAFSTDGGNDFTAITPTTAISTAAGYGAGIYKIDVYLQLANVTGGSTLGNCSFNVALPVAGLTLASNGDADTPFVAGWNPDGSTFSYHTSTSATSTSTKMTTANIWSGNADKGTSATDLQAILVEVGLDAGQKTRIGRNEDVRATIGQAAPVLVGDIYVAWDGTTEATVIDTKGAGTPWSLLTMVASPGSGTLVGQTADTMTIGNTVAFTVPEPATMVLLAIGGLLSLRRRR